VLGKPIRSAEVASAVSRLRRQGTPMRRVLVIDDDPLSLDLMRATLVGLQLAVTTLQDGRTALRELDRIRPDAIVLDLMMPDFDGFAVLDALRRLPAWQHLPVFIWTSMLLSEYELAGLARSASAIFDKGGGDLEPLVEELRRWRSHEVLP
jgi:CheY-like chemotaxis protein